MDWALLPLRRYAHFSGRARRLEYWMFVLLLVFVAILLSVFDAAFGLAWNDRRAGGILSSIFVLGAVIPLLAASVRRLHDTGRAGWWVTVPIASFVLGALAIEFDSALASVLIAIPGTIGSIATLVFCCLPGTPGRNRYGLDPKYSPDLEGPE
jgi:uncharacterized membrane protein YhaH (DUF805 family)